MKRAENGRKTMRYPMRQIVLAAATAAALFSPTLVEARGGGGGHGGAISSSAGHHSTANVGTGTGNAGVGRTAGYHQGSSYCISCSRDSHGHNARSAAAKEEFLTQTGYP